MNDIEGRPSDQRGFGRSLKAIEKAKIRGGVFAEAVQVTRMPMILSDPSLTGKPVVFANDAFLEFSGYSMEEVLGRESLFLAADGTQEQVTGQIMAALAEGRPELVNLVCRRKDGQRLSCAVSAIPLSDDQGQTKHFFSFLDRSERLALLESKVVSEQNFRLLVESVTDYAIYMLDPHGRVVSWNSGAERIKGYSEQEVLGQHVSLFYTEEEKQAGGPRETLETAEQEGRFETENWRVRKDGTKFLAHVIIHALRNEAGDLVGFAKVTRDITERQRIREAEHASEAKTQFLASMSHEIRTPLNGIIGYTERLMDGDLTPDQRRYTERIQTAGAALLTIINDILDLSQIEAGRIELEERPFSLEALVDNVISIIAGAAEEKRLPIRLTLDPDLPKLLLGDEGRLRQVLLNLLNNAVKFTQQGHIALTIKSEGMSDRGERLFVSVKDTGIGIPQDKRYRLFRRFSQIDRSVRREYGGTGLGLAISKRLIDLMGGEIGLESEEGKGSNFWFRVSLPLADPDSAVETVEERPPEESGTARILLAEDLEINQELARTILEAAGHDVDAVWDGDEAVSAVTTGNYDMVLMDIQMPVKDGIAATREIRAMGISIPIIAMTANVLPQQIRAYKQVGMDDHIGKPMKRNDLLKKVNDWAPSREMPEDVLGKVEVTGRPVFDSAAFKALCELLGSDRTTEWLKQLEDQLKTFPDAGPQAAIDRPELRRRSHALVSHAGNLGFFELSDACMELESACDGEQDLETPLKNVRDAAARVLALLPTIAKDALAK